MELRGDVERGTVELDQSEQAELTKVEGKFAKRLERARWKGLDPSSREEEHRFAKRRHAQALKEALEDAAAQDDDERLRNSARRILDGRSLLYALTPTPDSVARALAAGKPGMRAFFGYPDSNPFRAGPSSAGQKSRIGETFFTKYSSSFGDGSGYTLRISSSSRVMLGSSRAGLLSVVMTVSRSTRCGSSW